MKPVQYFSDDYLEQCRHASPEAIIEYLEGFRTMKAPGRPSKLISIKMPEGLLKSFRARCAMEVCAVPRQRSRNSRSSGSAETEAGKRDSRWMAETTPRR